MYKNFSYIFGLGVLLLLTACDSGDKKATDGKQKTAEPQKLIHTQKEETESVKEISSKDQTELGSKENDIYADINKPIEDVSSSEVKGDVKADNITNLEELKIEEDITVSSQNEEPVADIEATSEIIVNSTPESDTEKVIQEEGPKSEETQPVNIVNDEPKVEEVQSTEVPNNAEPTVVANERNTENSSDIPVVSEEPVEDKSSAEIRLDSEPAPVMDEGPVQEVVSESESAPITNEVHVQEVVNESEPAPVMDETPVQEVVSETKN